MRSRDRGGQTHATERDRFKAWSSPMGGLGADVRSPSESRDTSIS